MLSLLDHYQRGDILIPSYRYYSILLVWFNKPAGENLCFDQFLTSCYFRAEELSPSYPCKITIAEVILYLGAIAVMSYFVSCYVMKNYGYYPVVKLSCIPELEFHPELSLSHASFPG